jgi:2,4-dienoyl-CoA reductase-like NADH-dependent reductase (Old Yellow Enzyme family)
MAPFLKGNALFASRDALEAEIRRRGASIALEPKVRELLRPTTIGGRAVGNRFVIHPMEGCDGTLDGKPAEVTYHRWGRFARGGAKIIWGEAMAVVPEGRANVRQLWMSEQNTDDVARLIEWSRQEHRKACGTSDDLLIGAQLTHSGRWGFPAPSILFHDPVVDAFTFTGPERRPLAPDAPVMTDDALARLQDAYVAAAKRAHRAGFDFIDIKQCHRYLLSELLAARTRPGRFGGPIERRTSFVREIFGRLRAELGPDVILATRMNVFDGIPFRTDPATGVGAPVSVERPYRNGFGVNEQNPLEPDLREPMEAVRLYREAGLQLLNVTLGCPYFNPHYQRPADTPPPDGYEMPESGLDSVARHFEITEQFQRAFADLPVVGSGYSYLRHFAAEAGEANLRAGRVGLVGLGRGAIAYPDFVRDLAERGAMERAKSCITVSYCTTLMRAKGNELGQYASGCVPRDPVYAKLLQEIKKSKGKVQEME